MCGGCDMEQRIDYTIISWGRFFFSRYSILWMKTDACLLSVHHVSTWYYYPFCWYQDGCLISSPDQKNISFWYHPNRMVQEMRRFVPDLMPFSLNQMSTCEMLVFLESKFGERESDSHSVLFWLAQRPLFPKTSPSDPCHHPLRLHHSVRLHSIPPVPFFPVRNYRFWGLIAWLQSFQRDAPVLPFEYPAMIPVLIQSLESSIRLRVWVRRSWDMVMCWIDSWLRNLLRTWISFWWKVLLLKILRFWLKWMRIHQ